MTKTPFYDDPSYDYKAYWRRRKYEDEADRQALRKLLVLVPFRDRLVDIGAGFGRLSAVYLPLFNQAILVDPSEKMLARAKKKIVSKRVKFVKAYAEKMPFKKASFEVVLVIRTCHHLEDILQTLTETARILKPGGFLILEYANKLHLKARLRALLRLDFGYFTNLKPVRLGQSKRQKVPFCNYHPAHVEKMLKKAGFRVTKRLSVSNFRNPLFKKLLPLKLLLFLESLIQEIYAPLSLGPSIFLLCQKTN